MFLIHLQLLTCQLTYPVISVDQILQAHQDEVWFLKFSDNGKFLASASNDKTAIVWEVNFVLDVDLKSSFLPYFLKLD